MSNVSFWKDAGIRAGKTVVQAAAPLVAAGQAHLFSLDWSHVAEVSLGAGLLSLLMSVGGDSVASAKVARATKGVLGDDEFLPEPVAPAAEVSVDPNK